MRLPFSLSIALLIWQSAVDAVSVRSDIDVGGKENAGAEYMDGSKVEEKEGILPIPTVDWCPTDINADLEYEGYKYVGIGSCKDSSCSGYDRIVDFDVPAENGDNPEQGCAKRCASLPQAGIVGFQTICLYRWCECLYEHGQLPTEDEINDDGLYRYEGTANGPIQGLDDTSPYLCYTRDSPQPYQICSPDIACAKENYGKAELDMYEYVRGGKCVDSRGFWYDYLEYNDINGPTGCAAKCRTLSQQHAVGFESQCSEDGWCRCLYEDGYLPDPSDETKRGTNNAGVGPVDTTNGGDVPSADHECYKTKIDPEPNDENGKNNGPNTNEDEFQSGQDYEWTSVIYKTHLKAKNNRKVILHKKRPSIWKAVPEGNSVFSWKTPKGKYLRATSNKTVVLVGSESDETKWKLIKKPEGYLWRSKHGTYLRANSDKTIDLSESSSEDELWNIQHVQGLALGTAVA